MPAARTSELETYERLLCEHLEAMTRRLRLIPPDSWDWSPDPAAPTARILAAHAWQWLQCDRQHILEPDPSKHPRIPEPPDDPMEMCDLLARETEEWRELIRGLTPDRLAEPRSQFDSEPDLNVRWFLYHMIQNSIYKHGQLSMLFFALGLDGAEPYTAPFPNPIYEECYGQARTP
jgi:hypothetical protein